MPIDLLLKRLARPAQRAIQAAGIKNLEELSHYREQDIAALHGIGKHGLQTIKTTLAEYGLSFAG
jgi:hypothetical protein